MSTALTVIGTVVAVSALAAVVVLVARTYLNLAARRLVTCPETQQPAAVKLDVKQATVEALHGRSTFHLSQCSRWPEREGCGQECVAQIERAPDDCRVRTIAVRWFEGQRCVYCRKAFEQIHWHDHPPALRGTDGVTRTWPEIRAEELPGVLATSRAVCWNCHNAETFRREHPDLVIDRPPRPRPHA